jgi:hypothetical protein
LESANGVLGAELKCVILGASVSELEHGILASGDESVVVDILEGENLVNNLHEGGSVLHLLGKVVEVGVFRAVGLIEVAVGSETIGENIVNEAVDERVASDGDHSENEESVEGKSHMEVDVVLGTGAIWVKVKIFLILTL